MDDHFVMYLFVNKLFMPIDGGQIKNLCSFDKIHFFAAVKSINIELCLM